MTEHSNNPFILPGLGQTGEMASNPLFASLEMLRQTFGTMSGANGLAKGLAMQPTLDPLELEKKINELKSVESWLKLNLSMLSGTIQGMEVQLATITTLQQFMSANNSVQQSSLPQADAGQAWWNMLTKQFEQLATASQTTQVTDPKQSPPRARAKKTTRRPATKK